MVDLAVEGLGPGELIGGGASSTVFAATRLAFGDRVAVKVLKQTLTDEQSRSHFEREARALRELADIPAIVAVLDSGVNVRGEPYLVFPLFENSAQGDVNAHGAMEPLRAARLVAGAARAVHGGHLRGVIHRDLKPANLLLTNSDDIFVSDFGIAKLTDSSVSASGWLGLTPAYAPPEALEGLPAGVMGDVYSLGATLAALVIGSPPFSSTGSESPIALLNRVVNQPAPDLTVYGAPFAIAAAVSRAMAKQPADRHGSALELATELEHIVATGGAATADQTVFQPVTEQVPAPPPSAVAPPAVPAPPPSAAAPPAVPAPQPPSAVAPPAAPAPPPPQVPAPQPAVVSPPVHVPAPVAAITPPGAITPAAGELRPPTLAANAGSFETAAAGSAENPGKKKVVLGVAALAAVALVGGLVAFVTRGNDTASSTPEPTAVVVAEPTVAPVPTAQVLPTPTVEIQPTAIPEPTVQPVPTAVAGGPIDVFPDGSGEAASLASAVARARDGDVIRLAAGRFEISDVIRVQSDVTIVGAGIDETILVGTADAGVLFFESTSGRLRHLTVTSEFEPVEQSTTGIIEVNSSPSMVIENVKTTQSPGFGLAVLASTVTVVNSTFESNRLSGVGIGDASTVIATSNISEANGESGFVIFDNSQVTFTNNTASSNGLAGYSVQGPASPLFMSNIASNNSISGFQMSEGATAIVQGNTSMGNAEAGFAWFDDSAGAAIGNTAEGNTGAGFSMNDDSTAVLTANTSIGNEQSGFVWGDQAGGTGVGNRADGNSLNGYAVINSASAVLRANSADGNGEDDVLNATDSTASSIDEAGVIRVAADGSGDVRDAVAAVAQASSGDVIRLGAGAFQVAESIVIGKDLTIIGAGPDATTLEVTGQNTVLLIEDTPIRLLDMSLTTSFVTDSDDQRFSVVEIDGSASFALNNVAVNGSVGIGVGLFGSVGTVTNSQIADNHWSGIGVSENAQVNIGNVELSGNGQSGIVFFEDASGTVAASLADGNTFFGFSVQGSGGPLFTGNTASNNAGSGFASAETATPTHIGNQSRTNGESGFTWFDEAAGEAIANVADGNTASGFTVSGSASTSLTANQASRNRVDGFTWFETSSGVAVGNSATGNVFDGFAAEGESSPTLERNSARDNERRSFNQSDEATPTLTDNEFS